MDIIAKKSRGPAKELTPQQMKFATLIVYGVEGNPVTKTEAARRRNLAAAATTEIARGKVGGYYIDQKIIRHGNIDDMNLSQLYERMREIKEKNERLIKAKEFLAKSNEGSVLEDKEPEIKKLPSLKQENDQD